MDCIAVDIPKNLENMMLPDPALVNFYKNIENRIIWLDSDVDENWLEYEKLIVNWNIEDIGKSVSERNPIKLMIYSYGGDLEVNYSFIDLIEKSETPIWSINMGKACSSACFISVACHKRFAMPRATYLVHQGAGGFSGTYDQVLSAIVEYQRQIDELGSYLIERTNISKELLDERFSTDWYITATEALELGICDKIIESIEEVL